MSFHWKRKELLKYLQLLFTSYKQRLESREELNKNAWRPVVVRWGGEAAVRDAEEVVGALSIRCGVEDLTVVLMRQVWPMYPINVAGKWHRSAIYPTDPQWSGRLSPLSTHALSSILSGYNPSALSPGSGYPPRTCLPPTTSTPHQNKPNDPLT